MDQELVFGREWITAKLPDDARLVAPGLTLPLPPAPDFQAEIQEALRNPLDGPALRERAQGAGTVTLAFDDPTVPCYAPLWPTAIPRRSITFPTFTIAMRLRAKTRSAMSLSRAFVSTSAW